MLMPVIIAEINTTSTLSVKMDCKFSSYNLLSCMYFRTVSGKSSIETSNRNANFETTKVKVNPIPFSQTFFRTIPNKAITSNTKRNQENTKK